TPEEALRQPEFLRRSLESERGLQLTRNPGERNKLFRQYYRLIEGLDFCVGEALKELDRRGLAGNTVILFTSDNGHFAGEHGFFGKWFMHEESLRVPLLVFDPRAPARQRGQVSDAMALNLDIAPTLLELAGLRTPETMQGRSLLPLLRNPKQPGRDAFFYEHLYTHAPKPPRHIEPCEGVRERDWKYIVWLDQAGPTHEELYDLRADPLETKNLAAAPSAAAKLAELRRKHEAFRDSLK
ncbi:MAG: sulfatase-like hydrolase/transferase, partial [Verrucomicrobia bacterium]|nr:sulfatase-like hydrolase/transferase [Verrucomicrobiota bacterium]